jgi:SP family arabinose:H+ symporter-like MFS transporter
MKRGDCELVGKTNFKTDRAKQHSSFYVVLLGATATLGGAMFGFDIAIIVGAGPFLVEHFALNDLALGWAYSSLLFGCVLGSVLAGQLTDRYGRRNILIWVALLFVLTSIGCCVAPTFAALVAARFAGGLAVGAVSVLSPIYVAEMAPPKIRGRMGATYQLSITAGILASFLINYCLRNAGEWNWRWMFLTGALPSLLFFAVLLKAPETPRFLFRIARGQEGRALLERLLGEEEAGIEAAEIEKSLATSLGAANRNGWPVLRRVLAVTFVLAILVQITGITAILEYTPLVLKSFGWLIDAALFSTFLTGGTNLLSTILSLWTIDRYGRRPLYILGSLGMAVSLLLIVILTLFNRAQGAVLLCLLLLFIASFASCIGPVFWTVLPEIFPNRARGHAMIVPVVTQWLTSSLVVFLFPWAFHRAGLIPTFGFLACMAGLQAFFAWRVLPETKGKTLEEIELFWNASR